MFMMERLPDALRDKNLDGRIRRIYFYSVLVAAALVSLWLVPVKWSGLWDVPYFPFPAFSEVLQNGALALQGRSNGFSRAVHGYFLFLFMAGSFRFAGGALLERILSGPDGRSAVLDRLTARERLSIYFMTGSLAYSLLWFGLGHAGFLNQTVAYAAGIIGWLPALVGPLLYRSDHRNGLRAEARSLLLRLKSLTRSEKAFLAFMGALFIFLSSNAAYYPTAPDTLASHAGLPNYYLQQGRITVNPYHIYSYLSQNTEMLILWSLLLGSEFAAQLLIWGFLAVWLILIWGFLERHAGSLVSMATVVLIAAIPTVTRSAYEFKNDASTGLFLFAHYIGLIEALRRTPEEEGESRKWFLFSGLALGGAIGHKLVVLPAAFFSFALLLGDSWFRRWKRLPSRTFVVPLLLGAIIVASPWLARSCLHTGNPIYPVFKKWFPTDEAPNLHLSGVYFKDLLFGHDDVVLRNIVYGVLRSKSERPAWGASALFLLFFASALFLPSARGFRLCWTAAFLSYWVLHLRTLIVRYHLGLLIFLIATLFALSWRDVLDRSKNKIHLWSTLAVLALIVMVSNVWINSQPSFSFLLSGYAPGNRYTMGNTLNKYYWTAHVFNTRTNEGEAVMFAGVYGTYPFKRKMFANGALDPEILGRIALKTPGPDELKAQLREMGVDHILFSKSFYAWPGILSSPSREMVTESINGLLSRHMRVRYALPDRSLIWYSFKGPGEAGDIRLNERDAESFPGEFIDEAKYLLESGNGAEARRLLDVALRTPMLERHKRKARLMRDEINGVREGRSEAETH